MYVYIYNGKAEDDIWVHVYKHKYSYISDRKRKEVKGGDEGDKED
jgi:hypothetical protein